MSNTQIPVGKQWELPKRWVLRRRNEGTQELSEALGIDRVAVRILRNRGLETEEEMRAFLDCAPENLHAPGLLPDAEKAVALIREKLAAGAKIRIIGDYDVDGITASYILYSAFTFLHPQKEKGISVRIPDRMADGYGLNERLIREAADDGTELIVTCDNGIAAAAEIALAKELGMDVVVTDHHEVPYHEESGVRYEILPPADAVVDQKREASVYPFTEICGAVVAMKLCMLLFDTDVKMLADCLHAPVPRDAKERIMRDWVMFSALASVCDVMDLRDETRTLVKWGLSLMEHTDHPGIRALLAIKELEGKPLRAYHLGFLIGPCLNASGRLDTAMTGFALLAAKTKKEADALAKTLHTLNEERKQMTEEGVEEAAAMLEKLPEPDNVITVYLPGCHESLAGIIAGRLRERYARPAFVFTDAQQEGYLKGSGRSVEAYHMYDALHAQEALLTKYGGHTMAAGLTIEKANYKALHDGLNRDFPLKREELAREVVIDADMPVSYISEGLIEDLKRLEPFGKGNPKPVFGLRGMLVASSVSVFGKNRNVAKCILQDERGAKMQAVFFGEAELFAEEAENAGRLHILYEPAVDEYMGRKNLQIIITDYLTAK